jgi:hypothetical protein
MRCLVREAVSILPASSMRDGKAPRATWGLFIAVPNIDGISLAARSVPFPQSLDLEVLRRLLAAIAHDFKLDSLALVKGAQPGAFDRRYMHEHVLTPALRLNKSIALCRIEPLHVSSRHRSLRIVQARKPHGVVRPRAKDSS